MEIKFKDIPRNLRKYVTEGIRKAFKYSPLHGMPYAKARVEKPRYKKDGSLSLMKDVSYQCIECKVEAKKGFHVDHIDPVVQLHKTLEDLTLSEYYARVFTEDLQLLCKKCHHRKTAIEKMIRASLKRLLK